MSDASVIARGLIRIEKNGIDYLGVDTGIPANSPTLRKLAGQRRQSGWIVGEDGIEEWNPTGFVEHDGRVHVYGPVFDGRSYDEVIADESGDRLEAIACLADALAALQRASIPIAPFHSRGYILSHDGRVLVVPPDILSAIRDHQDYAERIARMERFIHPDRTPEENVAFVLSTSVYYALTGQFPFEGENEEELHARIRGASPLPAHYQEVSVREDVSNRLQNVLASPPDKVASSAEEFSKAIRSWNAEGARRDLSEADRAEAKAEAEQVSQKNEKSFRRKEAVRKNGRKVVIIALIAIVIGSIPATIIRNALAPRATAGLPPEEVVAAFYTSINTLDHMTMEDAVIDDAGLPLVREVTNVFILDRQRMSVEMQSGYVDAASWREEGMPFLQDNRSPYGVYNLQLESRPAPDGEVAYRATYERWSPDFENAEALGVLLPVGTLTTDDLKLRLDREDWVIYEMQTIAGHL